MEKGIMFEYNRELKSFSRDLRINMTPAETKLWGCIRREKIHGVKFYRQKPILNYIADFYAHEPKLIIECDGSQHYEEEHIISDYERDKAIEQLGIKVLRFDNQEIMNNTDAVMQVIWETVEKRLC